MRWAGVRPQAAWAHVQDLALLTMPQPKGNLQPGVEENIPGIIPTANTITRHGGMMHPAKRDRRRIVVDMREFGSPLPCVLHQQTMDIVPRTLEVRGSLWLSRRHLRAFRGKSRDLDEGTAHQCIIQQAHCNGMYKAAVHHQGTEPGLATEQHVLSRCPRCLDNMQRAQVATREAMPPCE